MSFRSVNAPGTLGYRPGLQRHHILPRQILVQSSLARMIAAIGHDRLGFHDFRRNGLLLPATDEGAMRIGLPLHRGPHHGYNELVLERLGQIERGWQSARCAGRGEAGLADALFRIDLLQRALRRRLLDPSRWRGEPLNTRDPALDFSHLDRMAETLWGATEGLLN